MNASIQKRISDRMIANKKGTIFTNSDFYDIGGKSAVEKALSRLTKDRSIYRLFDGFYTIPKYSNVLQEYSFPSPSELAAKIAEKCAWRISPYGETALNLFGFSTQVTAGYEYISDGPYRTYDYMGRTIQFKHTNNRSISLFSKELSLVIQVIKALGRGNITKKHILKLAKYCQENVKEDIRQETKQVTAWIYNVLKEISEVNVDA